MGVTALKKNKLYSKHQPWFLHTDKTSFVNICSKSTPTIKSEMFVRLKFQICIFLRSECDHKFMHLSFWVCVEFVCQEQTLFFMFVYVSMRGTHIRCPWVVWWHWTWCGHTPGSQHPASCGSSCGSRYWWSPSPNHWYTCMHKRQVEYQTVATNKCKVRCLYWHSGDHCTFTSCRLK